MRMSMRPRDMPLVIFPDARAEIASVVAAPPSKPEVLVIDDNPFILDAWQDKLGSEVTIHTMTSQEDLVAKIAGDAGFLDRLTCVVTDMYLDGPAGDGLVVGRLIKSRCPTLTVLLSSDGIFAASQLAGAVDRVIGKEPMDFDALRAEAERPCCGQTVKPLNSRDLRNWNV